MKGGLGSHYNPLFRPQKLSCHFSTVNKDIVEIGLDPGNFVKSYVDFHKIANRNIL